MQTTDLGGHSGCHVLLCEKDVDCVFVRKIASNIDYNNRLKIQAEKQKKYSNEVIKTPAVLGTGYTDEGLFYFDMEYIQGITLAEYMNTIEIGRIKGLLDTIVKNIVPADYVKTEVNEEIFVTKIRALEENLQGHNNPTINSAIKLLKHHSWMKFIETPCHGDLTLENIIVKDNQLYLIDFLDSFYDCWILDVSTLMQDVQTMWSYRFQEEVNINTLLRLIVFRDILMDMVRSRVGDDAIEVYYALLLKLIRIYPYTKEPKTYEFLNEKTESIINIIKGAS